MMLMVTMFCAAMCRGQAPASANSLPSVSELQNQGVDTICTYYRAVRPDYFFPLLTGNDFAFINYKFESKFVFWKKNGKNYFYFTSPDVFYPVTEFSDNSFWSFYLRNQGVIDTEMFKKPIIKRVDLETEQITLAAPETPPGFVDAEERIDLYISNRKIEKRLEDSDFEQFFWAGAENVNYSFNMHTKTAQLQKIIDDFCKDLLKDKKPANKG
jgi:hypothetical protein